ncbi:polysaccharide deacetylase family protein [uncultured Clostridium sp.]|uniref:polysaccharide deacetylase family protein n=1 Tax=uncultured Clostridium sp. TaxID=59620 RepID=UPI0026011D2A|nr:polysaccharide deacetylase family protein [uncultured Clostridium sp.]
MKKIIAVALLFITFLYPINNVFAEDAMGNEEERKKVVYLTFDDGPSKNTPAVLEVLKKHNIKATFFVVGEQFQYFQNELKLLLESGNPVHVHCYRHSNWIYGSQDNYCSDYKKCKETLKSHGWQETKFVRFPGGSSNKYRKTSAFRDIRQYIVGHGLYYVDWNVSAEDAIHNMLSPNEILCNVKKYNKDTNTSVLLMHDGGMNKTAAAGLEKVIEYFKSEGYEFKCINDDMSEEEIKLLADKGVLNKFNKEKTTANDLP